MLSSAGAGLPLLGQREHELEGRSLVAVCAEFASREAAAALINAHLQALAGELAACRVPWAAGDLLAHVAPLRSGNRVSGCVGGGVVLTEPVSAGVASGEPGWGLTRRQREILRLLADGADTRTIARRLVLEEVTVRNHVSRILRTLGAHSRLEAIAVARRSGVL